MATVIICGSFSRSYPLPIILFPTSLSCWQMSWAENHVFCSLGASHDGTHPSCAGEDNFIMTNHHRLENKKNSYYFSCCSQAEMYLHIRWAKPNNNSCWIFSRPDSWHHLTQGNRCLPPMARWPCGISCQSKAGATRCQVWQGSTVHTAIRFWLPAMWWR